MAEAENPVPNETQVREAQALVGALGALSGLRSLPLVNPDSDPVPMMSIEESVSVLGDAEYLPGPVRLELLARLVHARNNDHAGLAHADLDLGSISRKLMKSEVSAGLTDEVMQRLDRWRPGTEPLGRVSVADFENLSLRDQLKDDVACTALTVMPGCGAVSTSVKGIQALSIVTDVLTCKEFDEFETLIDPHEWPNCWLESLFFRSMVDGPGSMKLAAPDPDKPHGWQRTLVETVDFALGTSGDDSQCLVTELNMNYFWNGPPVAGLVAGGPGLTGASPAVSFAPGVPAAGALTTATVPPVVTRSPVAAAGCTYDLKSSVDDKILVDQGFLLVEEIAGSHLRRYRTQKEICFASGNLPAGWVCSFWSLASGLIMQGC